MSKAFCSCDLHAAPVNRSWIYHLNTFQFRVTLCCYEASTFRLDFVITLYSSLIFLCAPIPPSFLNCSL